MRHTLPATMQPRRRWKRSAPASEFKPVRVRFAKNLSQPSVKSPRHDVAVEKLCLDVAGQDNQGQEILSLNAQIGRLGFRPCMGNGIVGVFRLRMGVIGFRVVAGVRVEQ
jgi:hypothetical protein